MRIHHTLSQRPSLTSSSVTLDAMVRIATRLLPEDLPTFLSLPHFGRGLCFFGEAGGV